MPENRGFWLFWAGSGCRGWKLSFLASQPNHPPPRQRGRGQAWSGRLERRGSLDLLMRPVRERGQNGTGAIAAFDADYAPPDVGLAAKFIAEAPREGAALQR